MGVFSLALQLFLFIATLNWYAYTQAFESLSLLIVNILNEKKILIHLLSLYLQACNRDPR